MPFSLGQLIADAVKTENKAGSDCSGTDGTASRVLTLANTSLTADVHVYLDGLRLHSDQVSVTNNNSSSTATITPKVWDNQKIVVDYIEV